MMFVLLFLSLTTRVLGFNHDGRIVGGDDIPIEKVPYQVSIEINGGHDCGGSIISPTFIVSAAHCFQQISERNVTIRAGTATRELGGEVLNVKKINNHPEFSEQTIDYDVSVLELETPLDLGFSIAQIALPKKNTVWAPGTKALISGWGLLHYKDQQLPVNLQGAVVETIEQKSCVKAYGDIITERMFCAGVNGGGVDSCSSDSGGPLQIDGILAGIVSFGNRCGDPEYPGVYTNVSVVLDFIQSITKQ